MSNPNYHNKLLFGFVATNSGIVVYVKQCEETGVYAVKVKHKDGTKTVHGTSYTLYGVLNKAAQLVSQFSCDNTTWREL